MSFSEAQKLFLQSVGSTPLALNQSPQKADLLFKHRG
jgi:hypothetical protein